MMHVYVIVMFAQFIFLFLARTTSKPSIFLYKNTNPQQFSIRSAFLSIIEMTANFAVKALACSSGFNLSFEHFCGSSPTDGHALTDSGAKPRSSSQHSMQRIYYQKINAVPNILTTKPFFSFKGISNLTVQPLLFYFLCSSFLSLCSSIFPILILRQRDFRDCWTPKQKLCLMALFYSNGCKFRSPYAFKKPSRTIYKEN